MKFPRIFLIITVILLAVINSYSDDRADATKLMNTCDKNAKTLEIAVTNFGDKDESASYQEALKVIKLGKVKLAQSKFNDAKAKFNEYLKIENDLYASLSPKYMERAQVLIDEIAEDLVDYVTNPNVLKNFTDADMHLKNAKSSYSSKNYQATVISCRLSKYLVINCYVYVKKQIPDKYKKDLEDYYNRIYKR